MYKVITAFDSVEFSEFQEAKNYFYHRASYSFHKISLLTNKDGLIMIAQTDIDQFQTIRGRI